MSDRVHRCNLPRRAPPTTVGEAAKARPARESATQSKEAGAAGALYTGAGDTSAYVPLPGRGGHRNSAGRVSYALSDQQARELLAAADFALKSGLAFNRWTTVHWRAAGVADGAKATACLVQNLRKAANRAGGPFACVWVRENPPGKGEHVHILWHGPEAIASLRGMRPLLRRCGASWKAGVCRTDPVDGALRRARVGDQSYLESVLRLVGYSLKGADAEVLASLGLERREAGGRMVGKRSGASQNIGPAARAKNGFE